MNNVIVAPEKDYHGPCDPPYVWKSYNWLFAAHPLGSYWQCPKCKSWWKVVDYLGFLPCSTKWRRVRWFHFADKAAIRAKS